MNNRLLIGGIVGLGIVIIAAMASVYQVRVTQQALILQFGNYIKTVQEPGLHFKLPFLQDVTYMDKRVLSLDLDTTEVIAEDAKRLRVDALVRFRIADPLEFYKTVQGSEEKGRARLKTTVVANLRRVLGRELFATLLTEKRAELMDQIRDLVDNEAKNYGVEIVDVRIKRADLPEEVSAQVFNQMRAEYQKQAAELRATGKEEADRIRGDADRQKAVILAEANRDAQIVRGEGDAEAVKIFAEAFGRDIDFFEFYRTMQAYQQTVGKDDTTLVLSPDSEFFKYLRDVSGK